MSAAKRARRLRPGDVVTVRSAREILATLDESGAADAMPFMPEMLQHSGLTFTVSRRVEKACDTVGGGSRRMRGTVQIDDLRCDGSAHGGCDAGCRLYWKEAWLTYPTDGRSAPASEADGHADLEALANSATTVSEVDALGRPTYRCQATELRRASEPLKTLDLRQYVRELTAGNSGIWRFLRVAARAVAWKVLGLHGQGSLPLGAAPDRAESAPLALKPGDWVQVKSRQEIASTLDRTGKTRGLWFDHEMIRYCGGTYRVKRPVRHIIDEGSGRMIDISTDCFVLDGVVCTGECSRSRWFCPRGIYPFWREAWLQRVAAPDANVAGRRF